MKLPRLYAITDTRISGLSHPQQVESLCAGGATLIQLREKELADREFYHQAKEALRIAKASGATLLINDRVDIALAIGADGVHLGQHDLPPEAARALLPKEAIIGLSTHNREQFTLALTLPLDYVAIGPIFHTSTKENPDPVVGLAGVRKARNLAPHLPLVAIGGIGLGTAIAVLQAGADSVALVSSILGDKGDITARVKQFVNADSPPGGG